jgi:hypothetical protein
MPAGAEPELDARCGYSVRGGDNLGEHRRVPYRHRRHQRAQTQSRGDSRERGEGTPGFQRTTLLMTVEIQIMVGTDESGNRMRLARTGESNPMRPGDALLTLDHQAQLHDDRLHRRRVCAPKSNGGDGCSADGRLAGHLALRP